MLGESELTITISLPTLYELSESQSSAQMVDRQLQPEHSSVARICFFLTYKKAGKGKVIAILWTINDPPGLNAVIILQKPIDII